MVEIDNPFTRINRAAVILETLQLRPGMFMLDAGCGPGRLTIPAARMVEPGGRVAALDLQTAMLDIVKAKADAAGLTNIEFINTGLGNGNLDIGRFDRAILVTVLGEIPDQSAALEEIYKALKTGGILSITEIIFDPHFQRRSSVTHLAITAGFREKAFYGHSLCYTIHWEKP
jgi:ubiquinone/menaquinone biosynthesis C-methylase UbiE